VAKPGADRDAGQHGRAPGDDGRVGRSGPYLALRHAGEVSVHPRPYLVVDLPHEGLDYRVAVLGPNGGGKTTLLQALLGQLPVTSGTSSLGPGVVVGELDQVRREFAGEQNVVDVLTAATTLVPEEARTLLAKFGLKAAHVERPAGSLSPGERTRAGLALLMARQTNCLVLDEPTNHLDLPAIEQLEQAVAAYSGTLLLVSHDRRLLEAVPTHRRLHVARGQVRED